MNEKKRLMVLGAVLALAIGTFAWAQERNLRGGDLTVALNGTDVWLQRVSTVTDGGVFAESAIITDGANVMVQCDADAYAINLRASAGNAVRSKSVFLTANEKYPFGLLQINNQYISFDSSTTVANCNIFERK